MTSQLPDPLPRWNVEVPIHSADGCHGTHVFNVEAPFLGAALGAAKSLAERHEAHGLRPGWVLEWDGATVSEWHNPGSLI